MSVCAVMLVKDEADIIEDTVRHLLAHVDHVVVANNMSSDGTSEILRRLETEAAGRLRVEVDDEKGYWQSRKTTALARQAFADGFQWVVPCDADEIWYAPDGRLLCDWLNGIAPDVMMVRADLYNHLPTALDDQRIYSPVRRIKWRQRSSGALPKVAVRARPDVVIEAGNHSARTSGTGLAVSGLVIRHFSWRTPEQYLRKIRNGEKAYSLTNLPSNIGEHWRMFSEHTDETVMAHFNQWFYSVSPGDDTSLILDPAPVVQWRADR